MVTGSNPLATQESTGKLLIASVQGEKRLSGHLQPPELDKDKAAKASQP